MNGARSRAGYSKKAGFEGGQMPLYRRIPKFGFKNHSRVEYSAINLDTLEKLNKEQGITNFNLAVLAEHGLVSGKDLVKVLGRGEVSAALNVEAHAFSAKAKEAIESKGGSVSVVAIKGAAKSE
jgi:large subunit ribosomal protein L15